MKEELLFWDGSNNILLTSKRLVIMRKEFPLTDVKGISEGLSYFIKEALIAFYLVLSFVWLIIGISSVATKISLGSYGLTGFLDALPVITGSVIVAIIASFPFILGIIVWRKKFRGTAIVLKLYNKEKIVRVPKEIKEIKRLISSVEHQLGRSI